MFENGRHKWQGTNEHQTRLIGEFDFEIKKVNANLWYWTVKRKDKYVNEGFRKTISRAKIRVMDVYNQQLELNEIKP